MNNKLETPTSGCMVLAIGFTLIVASALLLIDIFFPIPVLQCTLGFLGFLVAIMLILEIIDLIRLKRPDAGP